MRTITASSASSAVTESAGRFTKIPPCLNYVHNGKGPKIKPGLVLAIEPMINLGSDKVKVLEDGWTVITADGKPSAHFEHTIAVTANGPEILTKV